MGKEKEIRKSLSEWGEKGRKEKGEMGVGEDTAIRGGKLHN